MNQRRDSCCLPLESCFRVITLSEDLIGGLGKGRMGDAQWCWSLSACEPGQQNWCVSGRSIPLTKDNE